MPFNVFSPPPLTKKRKDMKRHIIIGKGNYCFCEGRRREKSNEKVYYYKSFKTISNL
jgi:hypothetical protein